MELPVQGFSALVQQMAATLQGTVSPQLLDMTVGSVLRAILEASASVALWLQWLVLQVLSITRAATSAGPDLDSWMADFSLTRLPATSAAGIVTFSRYTTGLAVTIPVQTMVRTSQGLQTYSVIVDTSNPAWDGTSGYLLAATAASVDVPVAANQPGAAGNIQADAINLLASPIAGIDTVSNTLSITGGINAESDAAFRARFQLYINSRSLATSLAVLSAVAGVQQGLRYAVIENQSFGGVAQIGHFAVITDDGTGSPPSSLLSAAQAAVEAVRPLGSTFSVNGPLVVPASVDVVLQTSNPLTHVSVAALVQQSILEWISGLPIGGILAVSKIEAIAHSVDQSVINVSSALINGVAMNLTAPATGVIIPETVVVS